jgi:large subunit ribosomal protein L24e
MSKNVTSLKKCFFCGKQVTTGQGIMLVKNDGAIQWTCSSKCKKNLRNLKRDPRVFKWTEKYIKGGIRKRK